jgi:hypothetical protein
MPKRVQVEPQDIAAKFDFIRSSPYFWWWLALTKNPDYLSCCQRRGQHPLQALYEDFGDVRYRPETVPELAFSRWFLRQTVLGVSRGEYLFGINLFAQSIFWVEKDSTLSLQQYPAHIQFIGINATLNRADLMQAFAVLIKQLPATRPKLGKYQLTGRPQIPRLQKQFLLYEAFERAHQEKARKRLYELGQQCHVTRYQHLEKLDQQRVKRHLSAATSRHLRQVHQIIHNVAYGVFPVAEPSAKFTGLGQ